MINAVHYIQWGVVQISLTNLLIIVGMLLLFAAAIVVPFPHQDRDEIPTDPTDVQR
jgi:hypothetical protein